MIFTRENFSPALTGVEVKGAETAEIGVVGHAHSPSCDAGHVLCLPHPRPQPQATGAC